MLFNSSPYSEDFLSQRVLEGSEIRGFRDGRGDDDVGFSGMDVLNMQGKRGGRLRCRFWAWGGKLDGRIQWRGTSLRWLFVVLFWRKTVKWTNSRVME